MTRLLTSLIPSRRGFSLVEVLIAVVVLSLGLLGLGAIFPVVVRQQRQATDGTLGTAALNSASAYVRSRADFIDPTPGNGVDTGFRGWRTVRLADENFVDIGEWAIPDYEEDTGNLEFPTQGSGFTNVVVVTAGERLFPAPFTPGTAPEFVWDFAARSTSSDAADALDAPIQVAVFVRRIDTGIRVPRNETFDSILTGIGMASPDSRRVPIGLSDSGSTQGLPSRDGRGVYAGLSLITPQSYTFDNNDPDSNESRDRLKLDFQPVVFGSVTADANDLRQIIMRPGQRLIDSRGTIYTVVRRDGEFADTVVIDPPVPASVANSSELGDLLFALTPPAAVKILTINP